MYSKHLFLYAFKPPKDKGYVDVKLKSVPWKSSEIHTAKVGPKSQLLSRHWGNFFFLGGGGGGGGGGGLIAETMKSINKKMLPWLLVG